MLCPHCNNAMEIVAAATQVEGDDSPLTPTRVYHVATLRCRNPDCPQHTGPGTQRRTLLYPPAIP